MVNNFFQLKVGGTCGEGCFQGLNFRVHNNYLNAMFRVKRNAYTNNKRMLKIPNNIILAKQNDNKTIDIIIKMPYIFLPDLVSISK